MSQQQLLLANKDAQERLQPIFEDIIEEILRGDEDILNELDPIVDELDDQDKQILFQYVRAAFPDHTFWKIEKFNLGSSPEKKEIINYKEIYEKEFRIERNWQNFLNLVKVKDFCEQNSIPESLYNKESLAIMQKLQEQSFTLCQLNELLLIQRQKPQQFIECLIPFLFDEGKLLENEQNYLEQIIGNLLDPKFYEMIEFQEFIFSGQNEQLAYVANAIQTCQLKNSTFEEMAKDQKINQQQILFVKLLCTQDIKDPKQNLNNYFSELLNIKDVQQISKIITASQMINKINQIALKDISLYEECYFRILFYFWIQYFNKLNQQNEIKQLEEDLKKQSLIENRLF